MSGKKRATSSPRTPASDVTSQSVSGKSAKADRKAAKTSKKDASTAKEPKGAAAAMPPRRDRAVGDAVQAVLHPVQPQVGWPARTDVAPGKPAATAPRPLSVAPIPVDAAPEVPPAAVPDNLPAAVPETLGSAVHEMPVLAVESAPGTPEAPPRAAAPMEMPTPVVAPTAASPAPPPMASPAAAPLPDFDAIARNMRNLMEESSKVAAELYKPRDDQAPPSPFRPEVSDAVQTLGQVAEHWTVDPARLIQAQASLASGFFDLWAKSARRIAEGAPAEPAGASPADKRFKDPEWRENPVFDFVHKAFLLGTKWANDLVDQADSLDDTTREKARFYVRQLSSAMSPSNFVPTNPELLRETVKESGANLVRGMKMLAEDIAAGRGAVRIRHTDTSKFVLGVNMATTPGKVVFRNDLFELLQYAPSTPDVLRRPLLIVPPWINKFYILDLNPEKSFIRWAVAQGLTVFVISWVNPDERHATKDFEAYMREGILAALDEIGAITGEPDVHAIGYCVGGTLLSVALAYMAAHDDRRIASATLFTAQVDFTHAGDLKVFADEAQIAALEEQMEQTGGYLHGTRMAQAFNMLRPEDLIWSYAVDNYLKGKAPPAFDLLAWNSDSARMPAANHSFYLRNCYLENNLARGRMRIAGETLDLGRITVPIYNLATREDHIAPAISVFEGSRFFGGPVRYVLSGSGHVAGVVNPPAKAKYGYTDGPPPRGTLADWLAVATEHKGSWWPDWIGWIRDQGPELVPAREPGAGRPVLGDAPGDYVRVKS